MHYLEVIVKRNEEAAARGQVNTLLHRLAILPVESPEWLDNPSVRVDLRAAVLSARRLVAQ